MEAKVFRIIRNGVCLRKYKYAEKAYREAVKIWLDLNDMSQVSIYVCTENPYEYIDSFSAWAEDLMDLNKFYEYYVKE